MRWIKTNQSPAIKNFRAIKRFAFLPIHCGTEYRWLEICYVFQSEWGLWYETSWQNDFFMTKEEYKIWNKGCKYPKWCEECQYYIQDGGCRLRYNAHKDDCGDCFRRKGFHGTKKYNSKK